MIESLLCCHFHILVGILHYRTWLVYSNDGLPQIALDLHEQASWMHTHLVSFVELTYSSSASVAWQSLLTHIDIYWWASPLPSIRLVDVRLSSPFCLLHNHHSIPPIVLCPWLTLMYCVKIEKVWEHQKYETIAWLVIGVVHDLIFCVMKIEHSQTIWFCRDNFLWPCYFEKIWLLC